MSIFALRDEGGHRPPLLFLKSSHELSLPLIVVLGVLLMVAGPLVPNHYLPWAAFYPEALTFLGLGLLCVFWTTSLERTVWSPISLTFAGLALVPPLQAVTHLIFFWGDAWVACAYIAAFSLAMLIGRALAVRSGADAIIALLSTCTLLSGLLCVLVALEQWLQLDQLGLFAIAVPPGGRPFANLGQPNQLATWLMLGFAGLHMLYQLRKVGAGTVAATTIMLCIGTTMTASRAGWVEMAVLLICLAGMRRRAGLRVSWMALAATGLLMAGLVVAWPSLSDWLMLGSQRRLQDHESANLRLIHWGSMLDAIGRRPLFGYGWNQVAVAQSAVATSHPASGEFIEHSHDILLDMLVWNGIPLGLLVLGVLAWWAIRQIRACVDGRVALLLAAIAVVFVHGLLEYPLEYAYFLLPVGLMVGLIEHLSPVTGQVRLPWGLGATLAAATTVLLVWIACDYVVVEDNTRELRFEMARIGVHKDPSRPPDVIVLTQQREFLKYARTQATRDMSAADLEWMREISSRFAYAPALLRYALAAGLNHEPDQAADAMARICKMHPRARCEEGLSAWHEMSTTQYPELSVVRLPPAPRSVVLMPHP